MESFEFITQITPTQSDDLSVIENDTFYQAYMHIVDENGVKNIKDIGKFNGYMVKHYAEIGYIVKIRGDVVNFF